MSNSMALDTIKDKKGPSINDFPPKLRELANFIRENYNFKSIQDACKLAGLNGHSINVTITKYRKKGYDFNKLLYNLLYDRNKDRLVYLDNAVYEKALDGNMTGAKLFYQRAGAIDTGSGGDRNVIINQINIPIATNTRPPIDLIKEWQEKDKDIKP